ncbi:MAG TPA: bifunctional nuclease family protein [Anaerolineaceae bacterium]|nr:bifunctional nuclease family protein [Anaerolineaceae bacterium]
MSRMVEVIIDSVRVSLTNQQRIVVLREANAERYLPIWIGPYEAESITIALQEIEVARPQTHDLLRSIIHQLNGRLVRVEVISLSDDVFYGNLVIEVNGQTMNVDSRPSDALALAVRAHVPILVAREVMDSAGIIPEQDLQTDETETSEEGRPAEAEDEGAQERLSVFEDFLQNLNIEDEEDDDDDEEPGKKGKPKGKK